MIGLLRLVGLLNAAVWLGGGILFVAGIGPATTSEEMQRMIGQANFPYYSGAIQGLLGARFLHMQLACSVVALVHLAAEWIYLGKYPRRAWLALVAGLFVYALGQAAWLGPRLREMHLASHAVNLRPEQRMVAARSFRLWSSVSRSVCYAALGFVGIYLWRVANPENPTRFVGAPKFHS